MAQPRVRQGTLCCSPQEGTGCLPAGQCPAAREGERLGQLDQVGASEGSGGRGDGGGRDAFLPPFRQSWRSGRGLAVALATAPGPGCPAVLRQERQEVTGSQ